MPTWRTRRAGRVDLRIVIAIVIALVGLVTYFTRTTVNPVTGEKQRVAMSVDQEKALGLRAAPQMAAQMGGAADPRTDPQARLVAEVGQRVLSRSDAGTEKNPYRGNFNFHLLNDDKTVNAFALPGGQIFITRALLNRMENEAQLAGVLGHEIGHVIHRHAAEHMAKGQLGQSLAAAVGVAASDERGRGQAAYVAAQLANQMFQLRYGRQDELESDDTGLKYMAQAGYDPSEMIRVMEILKAAAGGGGRGPSIMQTHPHPEDRIAAIKAYLQKTYPDGIPARLTKGASLRGGGGTSTSSGSSTSGGGSTTSGGNRFGSYRDRIGDPDPNQDLERR